MDFKIFASFFFLCLTQGLALYLPSSVQQISIPYFVMWKFSSDGSLAVGACQNNSALIYNYTGPRFQLVQEIQPTYLIADLLFSQGNDMLYIITSSEMLIYKKQTNIFTLLNKISSVQKILKAVTNNNGTIIVLQYLSSIKILSFLNEQCVSSTHITEFVVLTTNLIYIDALDQIVIGGNDLSVRVYKMMGGGWSLYTKFNLGFIPYQIKEGNGELLICGNLPTVHFFKKLQNGTFQLIQAITPNNSLQIFNSVDFIGASADFNVFAIGASSGAIIQLFVRNSSAAYQYAEFIRLPSAVFVSDLSLSANADFLYCSSDPTSQTSNLFFTCLVKNCAICRFGKFCQNCSTGYILQAGQCSLSIVNTSINTISDTASGEGTAVLSPFLQTVSISFLACSTLKMHLQRIGMMYFFDYELYAYQAEDHKGVMKKIVESYSSINHYIETILGISYLKSKAWFISLSKKSTRDFGYQNSKFYRIEGNDDQFACYFVNELPNIAYNLLYLLLGFCVFQILNRTMAKGFFWKVFRHYSLPFIAIVYICEGRLEFASFTLANTLLSISSVNFHAKIFLMGSTVVFGFFLIIFALCFYTIFLRYYGREKWMVLCNLSRKKRSYSLMQLAVGWRQLFRGVIMGIKMGAKLQFGLLAAVDLSLSLYLYQKRNKQLFDMKIAFHANQLSLLLNAAINFVLIQQIEQNENFYSLNLTLSILLGMRAAVIALSLVVNLLTDIYFGIRSRGSRKIIDGSAEGISIFLPQERVGIRKRKCVYLNTLRIDIIKEKIVGIEKKRRFSKFEIQQKNNGTEIVNPINLYLSSTLNERGKKEIIGRKIKRELRVVRRKKQSSE